MTAFVDFFHRDEYSLKCAHGNSNKILPLLKERNQTHLVVANYGEISNWVQQLFACKDKGIVPILGMETFVNDWGVVSNTPEDIVFKNLSSGKEMSYLDMSETERDMTTLDWPVGVFALTVEGYHNIISIHNDAQLYGVGGVGKRPRTSSSFLKTHGKGVIAILRVPYSDVGSCVFNGLEDEALERLEFYQNTFDDVYLGIPIVECDDYRQINETVVRFCQKHHVKAIPIINSHYINEDDHDAWLVLRELGKLRGGTFYEIESFPDMSYWTREKVDDVFDKHIRSDVFNQEVYESFQTELDNLLSRFTLLDIDYSVKLPKFENGPEKLREAAEKGFVAHGYDKMGKVYWERLDYEVNNIIDAGFADYFLVLEELFSWYKKNISPITAYGRGSAAGSLVLNCIGCTNVDPIKYKLLFERFLDAERFAQIVKAGGQVSGDSCPDVDSDFRTDKKDIVKKHFVDLYGEKCTASIGNIGFMKTKSTLKDLARLYNVPPEEINAVTKKIDSRWADDEKNEVTLDKLRNKYPELKALLHKYPQMGVTFEKLFGTITNWGVHAAGILITDFDLTDQLPLRRDDEGRFVTCWTEGLHSRELGMMGFIKFDMLNIEQLDIIEDTLKLIEKTTGKHIGLDDIPLDDYKALSQMNKHDGICIFQFDTQLAAKVTDHMKGIKQFEDLASLSTLLRPAALENGFDVEFGERRDGKSDYFVPDCLKPYLADTYGLPIYQEHIMQIAMELAGMDKVAAYKFMRQVYKGKIKSQEEKDEWRKKFVEGCQPKVIHDAIEVTFENNEKKIYNPGEIVETVNGKKVTIEEALEKGLEIQPAD